MSGVRVKKQGPSIALFPFLAVLICTIGVLVMLLVLVVQQARVDASTVVETQVRQKRQDVRNLDREEHEWRAQALQEQRNELMGQVGDQRLALSHLEGHISDLEQKAERLQAQANDLQRQDRLKDDERQAARAELARLQAEAEAAKETLDATREKARRRKRSYAIIPYVGSNKTFRRPIYLECTANGVILQPEGVVFTARDFEVGLQDVGNPLSTALRTVREYWIRRAGRDAAGEPYPLLIVRPDGAIAYSVARAAMKSWDDEFGYELVEAGLKLEFPPRDPQLVAELEKTIAAARQRQEILAAAAPSRFGSRNRGGYVATNRGGFAASFLDDEDDIGPPGGFGARGTGGGGVGGGTGGGDTVGGTGRFGGGAGPGGSGGGYPAGTGGGGIGAGPGRMGPGAATGGVAGGVGPGGTGPGGTGTGGGVPGGTGGGGGYGPGGANPGGIAGNGGGGSGGPGGTGTGTGTGGGGDVGMMRNGVSVNGPSLGGNQLRSGSPQGTGAGGFAGQPVATSGQPVQGNVAYGPSAQPRTPQFGLYNGPQPTVTPGKGQPVREGEPAGNANSHGRDNEKPLDPKEEARQKRRMESLAKTRGENWGLMNARRDSTGFTRPMRVICGPDQLVLMPDRAGSPADAIPIRGSMPETVDQFVGVLRKRIDGWGIAALGGYWKPVLNVEIQPGGEDRYQQLEGLLEGSGIDVKRK